MYLNDDPSKIKISYVNIKNTVMRVHVSAWRERVRIKNLLMFLEEV
jgi:hypothetical protein